MCQLDVQIATKKGDKKAPTVMLAAHMDEIGLMVRYIDDNGFIRFSTIGGINDQMLMNQTVTIHSSVGEDVIGVIIIFFFRCWCDCIRTSKFINCICKTNCWCVSVYC